MDKICHMLWVLLICLSLVNFKGNALRRRRNRKAFVLKANELTAQQQQFTVDFHNLKRSQVQPSATNMIKFVYDEELAALAKKYSRNCIFEHNYSPYTSTYVWPGEDLYVKTGVTANLTRVLERAIQHWFNEYQYYTYDTMECALGKECGHYTEMVWAGNEAVGCGVTTCGNLFFNRRVRRGSQLVVCNYGPGGNYHGEHPYKSGISCSACPSQKECVCAPEPEKNDEDALTKSEENDFKKFGFLFDKLDRIEKPKTNEIKEEFEGSGLV